MSVSGLIKAAIRPVFVAFAPDVEAKFRCKSSLEVVGDHSVVWKIEGATESLELALSGYPLPGSATSILASDSSYVSQNIINNQGAKGEIQTPKPFDIYDDLYFELETRWEGFVHKVSFFSLNCVEVHLPNIIQLAIEEHREAIRVKNSLSDQQKQQQQGKKGEDPSTDVDADVDGETEGKTDAGTKTSSETEAIPPETNREAESSRGRNPPKTSSRAKLFHKKTGREGSEISETTSSKTGQDGKNTGRGSTPSLQNSRPSTQQNVAKRVTLIDMYLNKSREITAALSSSFLSIVSTLGNDLNCGTEMNTFDVDGVVKHQLLLGVCGITKVMKSEDSEQEDTVKASNIQLLLEGNFSPFEAVVKVYGVVVFYKMVWFDDQSKPLLEWLAGKTMNADTNGVNEHDQSSFRSMYRRLSSALKSQSIRGQITNKLHSSFFESIRVGAHLFVILKTLNHFAFSLLSGELSFNGRQPLVSHLTAKDANAAKAFVISSCSYNKRSLVADAERLGSPPIPLNTFHIVMLGQSYSIDISAGGSNGTVFFNLHDQGFINEYVLVRSYITRTLAVVDERAINGHFAKEPTVPLRLIACKRYETNTGTQVSWTDIYASKMAKIMMREMVKLVLSSVSSDKIVKHGEHVNYVEDMKIEFGNIDLEDIKGIGSGGQVMYESQPGSLDSYVSLELFKLKLKMKFTNNPPPLGSKGIANVSSSTHSLGNSQQLTSPATNTPGTKAAAVLSLLSKEGQAGGSLDTTGAMSCSGITTAMSSMNVFTIEVNNETLCSFPIIFIRPEATNLTEDLSRSSIWRNIVHRCKTNPLASVIGIVLEYLLALRLSIILKDLNKYYKTQSRYNSLLSSLSYEIQQASNQMEGGGFYHNTKLLFFKPKDVVCSCAINTTIGGLSEANSCLLTIGGKTNKAATNKAANDMAQLERQDRIKIEGEYDTYAPDIKYSVSTTSQLGNEIVFKEIINDIKTSCQKIITAASRTLVALKMEEKHTAKTRELDGEMRDKLIHYVRGTRAVIFDRLAYSESIRNTLFFLSADMNIVPLLNSNNIVSPLGVKSKGDKTSEQKGERTGDKGIDNTLECIGDGNSVQSTSMKVFYEELEKCLDEKYILKFLEMGKAVQRIDIFCYADTINNTAIGGGGGGNATPSNCVSKMLDTQNSLSELATSPSMTQNNMSNVIPASPDSPASPVSPVVSLVHNSLSNTNMLLYNGKIYMNDVVLVKGNDICRISTPYITRGEGIKKVDGSRTTKQTAIVVSPGFILQLLNIKNRVKQVENQVAKLSEMRECLIVVEESVGDVSNSDKAIVNGGEKQDMNEAKCPSIVIDVHPVGLAGIKCQIDISVKIEREKEWDLDESNSKGSTSKAGRETYDDVYRTTSYTTILPSEVHPLYYDMMKTTERILRGSLQLLESYHIPSDATIDKREDMIVSVLRRYERKVQFVIKYNINGTSNNNTPEKQRPSYREIRIGRAGGASLPLPSTSHSPSVPSPSATSSLPSSRCLVIMFNSKHFIMSYTTNGTSFSQPYITSSVYEFQIILINALEQYLLVSRLEAMEEEVLKDINKRYALSLSCRVVYEHERGGDLVGDEKVSKDKERERDRYKDKSVIVKIMNGTFTLLVMTINIYGATDVRVKQVNIIAKELDEAIKKFIKKEIM